MRSSEPKPKPGKRGGRQSRGRRPAKGAEKKVMTTEKPDGAHNMTGDRTAVSVGEISRELPHREGLVFMLAREPKSQAGGSQSVRSSEETGNDRGAKGRRKVKA